MGCDIHLVLEKKNGDGKWVGLHTFGSDVGYGFFDAVHCDIYANDRTKQIPEHTMYLRARVRMRNYDVFAALAGVRGPGPDAKGLPDDASDLTRLSIGDYGDLHSHTWYSLQEATDIFALVCQYNVAAQAVASKLTDGTQPMEATRYFFGVWPEEDDPIDNYRVCIAFDN